MRFCRRNPECGKQAIGCQLVRLSLFQLREDRHNRFGQCGGGHEVAEQFNVPWEMIGDKEGRVDDDEMIAICDKYDIDYVVLARYMRILPAASCWKYAGGRIINLHHGLLPAFPGAQPYRDAYCRRMLTYGATVHFIVPELDAGDQIIHQDTFTVPPGKANSVPSASGMRSASACAPLTPLLPKNPTWTQAV